MSANSRSRIEAMKAAGETARTHGVTGGRGGRGVRGGRLRPEERQKAVAASLAKIRESTYGRAALKEIPPPVPVIDGLVFLDNLARMSSEPGRGKTFLALDMALCVATGTPWHGHGVRQGRVLYLVGEGLSGLNQRVAAWETYHKATVPEGTVEWLDIPLELHDPEGIDPDGLAAYVREEGFTVVIVDTQARYTAGMEENSNSEVGVLVKNLDRLKDASGACIMLVHHVTIGTDRPRGASALNGAIDTEMILVAGSGGNGEVKLQNPKQKNAAQHPGMTFTPYICADSIVMLSEFDRRPGVKKDPFSRPARPPITGSQPKDAAYWRVAFIVWSTFQHGASGGTRAEIKRSLQGDPDLKIASKNWEKRFNEAWSTLEAKGYLRKVGKTQRVLLSTAALDDMGAADYAPPTPEEEATILQHIDTVTVTDDTDDDDDDAAGWGASDDEE